MTIRENLDRILEFRQLQGWTTSEIAMSQELRAEFRRELLRIGLASFSNLDSDGYLATDRYKGIPVLRDYSLDGKTVPAEGIRVHAEKAPTPSKPNGPRVTRDERNMAWILDFGDRALVIDDRTIDAIGSRKIMKL